MKSKPKKTVLSKEPKPRKVSKKDSTKVVAANILDRFDIERF